MWRNDNILTIRRGFCLALGLACAAPAAFAAPGDGSIYLDRSYTPAERAAALVMRLTPQERASQMISSQSAAIPRLRIPAYGWWNEALHGAAREGTLDNANPPTLINTTSYPVSLSLGTTWNPALMYQEATMIGDEMREVVANNARDLNVYSPTINLGRDPRWGRNDETFSEDPYLTTQMGAQFINGMEGKTRAGDLLTAGDGYLKTATTIKHYAANNSEFNRLDGSSNVNERSLREYYTAAFRDIIRRSQPASIMSSYNEINGTPAAADVDLIDRLARQTYGFEGFFTSDCDAVYIIQNGHQWVPPGYSNPVDELQREAFANAAGEDLECQQGYHDDYNYANSALMAVDQNIETSVDTYNQNDIDVSVARLLRTRIQLGDLDPPADVPWIGRARDALNGRTWVNDDSNNAITETPERLAMARAVADRSIVLLKNQAPARGSNDADPLLPLRVPQSGDYRVAVIGHYAHPDDLYLGGYSSDQGPSGQANEVDGYEGLRNAVTAINPQARVDYYPGVTGDDLDQIDADAVDAAANYDAVVVYAGTERSTSSEGNDRDSLRLPGAQAELIDQVAARNPNTIVYMETVGNMNVESFAGDVPAMLWSSYNGMRKGEALADVVLGRYNPSGHLPFTWYRDSSQLPSIADYTIRPENGTIGRTYQYFQGDPRYPFGFGLSYTRFRYSDLSVSRVDDESGPTLDIQARVTNTGDRRGTDVAQLYAVSPDAAGGDRPRKRLRGFANVTLEPGQSQSIRVEVPVRKLAFFDPVADKYTVPTGEYAIQLATSSADDAVQQSARVNIARSPAPQIATVSVKAQAAGDEQRDIAQRLIFDPDTAVRPRVTVALSDQSLYGYIHDGASTPLPRGMSVSYESNRPNVVSVQDGNIRTRGSGVATLTASVAYQGVRQQRRFVIAVR